MNSIERDYLTAIANYENTAHIGKDDSWRLSYHIMPPVGWLNDPNGLAYFKGKYYVYFQYSPFSPYGGMKCWGLYTSTDLATWTYEGVKLCPDESFDVHGVYSGSALTDGDAMYLYYTGNVKLSGDYNYISDGREGNTVCVRTTDGIHYEKKHLLMKNQEYGEGLTCHVRDPKVWKENGIYYMVQGARTLEDVGIILLFESEDRYHWKKIQEIKSSVPFGYMWECPDLFELNGQKVLCFSPQGVEADGDNFQNIYQSGYCFLDGDIKGDYHLGSFYELDHGFDYYAPQSFLAPDGRRIQIGWMGLPDIEGIYENPSVSRGWQHAMAVPREITVKDGSLCQYPVKELELLRSKELKKEFTGGSQIETPRSFDLYLERENHNQPFELKIDESLYFIFLPEQKAVILEFTDDTGAGRTIRRTKAESLADIRILGDQSSLEFFINEGRQVFSTRYYPKETTCHIHIRSAEGVLRFWKMNSGLSLG